MSEITEGKMGFARRAMPSTGLDARLEKIAVEAARRKFSPEFMNRLDKIVVFRSLTQEALRRILALEFNAVERRVRAAGRGNFTISCSEPAKEFLLARGFDKRYGARPLKRAIERHLVVPLSNLMATRQVQCGDLVFVDRDEGADELCFKKPACSGAASTQGVTAFHTPESVLA